MKEEIKALLLYRLERAHESIEEAKILLDAGHVNTFINRLYYSCYYAVSALLLSRGLSSAKHSGIRSLFHQNFVKNGFIETELGQLYDRLFDNRQKSDYADLVRFDVDKVRPWLNEVQHFLNVVEEMIKKEIN